MTPFDAIFFSVVRTESMLPSEQAIHGA